MIVFAKYRVETEKIGKFIALLKQCESVIRQEDLITTRPLECRVN